MSSTVILERLRRFLLILSALLCVGTVIELLLANHWEDIIQLIPFALCGLGLVAIMVALLYPQRLTLLSLRGCMALVALGSLFGIYEHLENNLAFEQEIHPNAVVGNIFMDALAGANPLLAPGILALAAILAVAATYYHPALEYSQEKYSQ